MHPEEAEVVARAQTGNDEFLLGQGGGWLLHDIVHDEKRMRGGHPRRGNGPIVAKLALTGRVDRRDAAIMSGCHLQHLSHTGRLPGTEIKVIPQQQDEGIVSSEFVGTPHRMTVAPRIALLDQGEALRVLPRGLQIGLACSGMDDHRR